MALPFVWPVNEKQEIHKRNVLKWRVLWISCVSLSIHSMWTMCHCCCCCVFQSLHDYYLLCGQTHNHIIHTISIPHCDPNMVTFIHSRKFVHAAFWMYYLIATLFKRLLPPFAITKMNCERSDAAPTTITIATMTTLMPHTKKDARQRRRWSNAIKNEMAPTVRPFASNTRMPLAHWKQLECDIVKYCEQKCIGIFEGVCDRQLIN